MVRLPALARAAACALALLPATASAAITTYTSRTDWRTAMGSTTGNIVDDMNSSAQGNGDGASRGYYAISGTGSGGAFPNANANTTVNGTGYLRCFTDGSSKPCVLTFASAQTGLLFDVNPQSTNTGVTISVTLNNSAGSTSYVLSPSNVTTTFGLMSTVAFTTVTIAGQAATTTAWHGIDDVEFLPAAPIVSSVSPSSGPAAGGTAVTITGAGFNVVDGPPTVAIGGTAATSVSVTDYRTLTATTPAHAGGAASVLVTPPGTAGANAANSLFTYTLSAARTPAFGTPTPTADGFTVQLTNHDANWNWSGTATAGGTVSVSNTGLVTVTGVAPGAASTVTVNATRSGYNDGSASVGATSQQGAARTPAFGTPTPTADGFTVQLTNHDANWNWSGTATAGGTVSVSNTGLVTVTGVAPGAASTVTVTTTRLGYATGSATLAGDALPAAPTFVPSPALLAPIAVSGAESGGAEVFAGGPRAGATHVVRRGRLPVQRTVTTGAFGPVQRVAVPGAGVLRVLGRTAQPRGHVQMGLGSRRAVCAGRAATRAAGAVTIGCRLSGAAQRAVRAGRLRVVLRTTFTQRGAMPTVLRSQQTVWVRAPRVAVTG